MNIFPTNSIEVLNLYGIYQRFCLCHGNDILTCHLITHKMHHRYALLKYMKYFSQV